MIDIGLKNSGNDAKNNGESNEMQIIFLKFEVAFNEKAIFNKMRKKKFITNSQALQFYMK